MEAVRNNAAILESSPALKVEIEGHCDERGSSEYNLALGARRARSVRDALTGLGVSGDRMSTVSYGEELPLCKDTSESCWAQNRRGHLVELRR
jgi:peptidoglycan-associated lipoprotein